MEEMVIYLVPALAIIGLIVMAIKAKWVNKQDAGVNRSKTEKVKELLFQVPFENWKLIQLFEVETFWG